MIEILQGDCLEIMRGLPDSSVDAVVTDPPYFLIGSSGGTGFMGKEWDGIINLWKYLWLQPNFACNVARALKLSLVENCTGEAFIVQKNVNMLPPKGKSIENAPSALPLLKSGLLRKNDSVRLLVLTKRELLDSLREKSSSLITLIEPLLSGASGHAVFVIPLISPQNEHKNIVAKSVTESLKAGECLEREITFTEQEVTRIRSVIGVMTGILSDDAFMGETVTNAGNAASIANEGKYSATILCPTNVAALMKPLTLLLYALLVTPSSSKIQNDLITNFFKLTWQESLRVLKPGGHLLAFSGSRTYHRMACAIEDAGFEIRDQIMWVHSQGFPKSLDVSKAIDKAAGAERQVVGRSTRHVSGKPNQRTEGLAGSSTFAETIGMGAYLTAPATDDAKQWQGFGTALKPAHEPICLARKPLAEKNVAANVLRWGTGAINVDGCRVALATDGEDKRLGGCGDWSTAKMAKNTYEGGYAGIRTSSHEAGRWPANLIHDGSEEVVGLFPRSKSCNSPSSAKPESKFRPGQGNYQPQGTIYPGDDGSAARFFYCAKASRSERNGSKHPTVKPLALMRYLVRLITPPGGTVLDPFAGSGTTGEAAKLEGMNAILIEREPDYVADIKRRLDKIPHTPLKIPTIAA